MIDVRRRFAGCLFSILTGSDSGDVRTHLGAIYVPAPLRPFFPPAEPISGRTGRGAVLRALIKAADGPAYFAEPVLREERRGGRRAVETRLTKLGALRSGSHTGDILLIRRVDRARADYLIRLLPAMSAQGVAVKRYAGKRRAGIVPPLPSYRQTDLEEPRTLVARLERIEPIEGCAEVSVEFDGIDARTSLEDLDAVLSGYGPPASLALARTRMTARSLRKLGLGLTPGAWVQMDVVPPQRRGRHAWVVPLGPYGYTTSLRGTVARIDLLFTPEENPREPGGAGAAVPAARRLASRTAQACGIPTAKRVTAGELRTLLRNRLARTAAVLIRDVGQASFSSLLADDGTELLHFDAGWPISYNSRSAPPVLPDAAEAPVILSHWDWDHLHAFHSIPAVAASYWIVPDQGIGPGATRVARILHDRGRLKVLGSGVTVTVGASSLHSLAGPGGINDTGLVLDLGLLSGRRALLVGDAHYGAAGGPVDMLVATHHGAAFQGLVPPPTAPGGPCVVSVGSPNVYGHPSRDALRKHVGQGWTLAFTSHQGGVARGDRRLP